METEISNMEKEIPYEKMSKLGISRELYLSMPQSLRESFVQGKVTPLVEARIRSRSGAVYLIPMKLQLVRDRKGQVLLLTYPVHKEIVNDMRLRRNELEYIKKGNALRKEIAEGGKRRILYLQLDKETNSIVKRDAGKLNLSEKIAQLEKVKDIELGRNQKESILAGKPVELDVGGQKVTVGVDNREPQGFKVVNGDMDEWNKQEKIKYDLAHEGFMGYVMTDQNRWEYQQVVDRLSNKSQKIEQSESLSRERTMSSGMKM